MDFKDRLKKVIVYKGITSYKVAKDMHIAASTIDRYLKGMTIPNGKKLMELTSYLGVSPDWLLNGEGEMKISKTDYAVRQDEVDISFLGFRERLNEAISLAGVTPYKIAKDTGIANTTLSTYRNRDVKPGMANAKLLAEYLGVSPDWLLYDAGEMKANENDCLLVDSGNIEDDCRSMDKDDRGDFINARMEILKQKINELERVIALKDDMIRMKDEMILSLRDTIELLKHGQ